MLASVEKSSKLDEWLQNKYSFMTESLSPFTFFPVRGETSNVFTYRMALYFAVIHSIAATALKFINTNFIKKQKFYLSIWKKINLHLILNTIWRFQYGGLIVITWLILVQIWSESLPKYGSNIIKYFLCIVIATILGVNNMSKNPFIHLSTKSRGWLFLYKIFFNIFISEWNLTQSEHKLKYGNNNDFKLVLYISGMKLLKLV